MSDGCLSHNWKTIQTPVPEISRCEQVHNEFQSAVFLATVGEDAVDIFDGFKFEQEADT